MLLRGYLKSAVAPWPARLLLLREMVQEAVEAGGDLRVPFAPIVGAWPGVELVSERSGLEAGGEAADGFEERFLLAGGNEDVWSDIGVGGLDQMEWVAGEAGWTAGGAEEGTEAHALAPTPQSEAAAGDIDGGADGASEDEEVGPGEG